MPHTYKLAQFLCVGLLFVVWLALPHDISANVKIDAVVPGVCGNGIKEIGEQCDGGDLGGNSCSDLGYATGTVSCSASCSYDVSSCSNPTPAPVVPRSSGRTLSPGRTVSTEITRVIFKGTGYPESPVTLLLNGERLQTSRTDNHGNFEMTTHDLSPGYLTFSAVQKSPSGASVQTVPVTIRLKSGEVSQISDVVVPPSVDEEVTLRQNRLYVSGYAVTDAPINLVIRGDFSGQFITRSDSTGFWEGDVAVPYAELNSVRLQASMLYDGEKYLSAVVYPDINVSSDTRVQFRKLLPPDLNRDGRVNMVDFYILKFWLERPELQVPNSVDQNNDGVINFADFSIMAYYWTG